MKIAIAYNLHRVATWKKNGRNGDLRALSLRPGNKRAHTLGHVHAVTLTDVEFLVSGAGVRKVRTQGKRAVCAWARGTLAGHTEFESYKGRTLDVSPVECPAHADPPLSITFNPHKHDSFVLSATGQPIKGADVAVFVGDLAVVYGPRF